MLHKQLTVLKNLLYTLLALLCLLVLGLTYNLATGESIFPAPAAPESLALAPADSVHANSVGSAEVIGNEAGRALFKSNCTACHSLHDVVVGPALAGVTQRRPRKWLYSFVQNSTKVIESKDPYAVKLFEQYGKTSMPSFANLTTAELDSIFDYLDAQPLH